MPDFKFNTKNLIALITVLGVFALMFCLLFIPMPEKNRDIFMVILGIILRSAIDPIYRFMFPSKKETSAP